VSGQQKPEVLSRFSNVASFHTSGASVPQPLPPLHDVTLSWMGPLGMVLTGTELVYGVAYSQSSHRTSD
jgi:hypothetical protein